MSLKIRLPYIGQVTSTNKNRLQRFHLIFILLICLVQIASAKDALHRETPTSHYHLTNLTKKGGLLDNKVTSIAKDKLGTYWIGTNKGLNRIFENKVIHYNEVEDFQNREILFVVKDAVDNIWVATPHDLYIYHANDDTFHQVSHNSIKITPSAYCLAKEGIIFSTADGIFQYHYREKHLLEISPRKHDNTTHNCITMYTDTLMLVANSSHGVQLLNLKTNQHTPILQEIVESRLVRDILIDSKQHIWISVHNYGLLCYSLAEGKILKHFLSELSNTTILDLVEYKGHILAATDGKGIDVISMANQKVQNISDHINLLQDASSINTIFVDETSEGMWLGTIREGILAIRKSYISNFTSDALTNDIKNNSIIQALHMDNEGKLWFGTDGGGLNYVDQKKNQIKHISSTKGLKVTAIESINSEYLLITAYNKGVFRVEKSSGKLDYITIVDQATNKRIINYDITLQLAKYSPDKIHLIANNLFTYNIASNTISSSHKPEIISSNSFSPIYNDSQKTIIQNSYKIYSIDNQTGHAELIFQSSYGDIISSRLHQDILYINKDHSLLTLDLKSKQSKPIPFPYNKEILSLEIDKKGNIWCITYDKLICLQNGDLKKYRVFDSADGLSPNDVYTNLSIVTPDSTLYFGGRDGITQIDKRIDLHSITAHDVSLISITVDGKKRSHSLHNNLRTIRIPWDYQSISFQTSQTGDNVFRENQYRYIIQDKDRETVIESNNSFSLPVLSPGKYQIMQSNLLNNGQWDTPKELILVEVTPPWWKSMMVQIAIYLGLCLIATSLIWLYYKRKRKEAKSIFKRNEEKLNESKINFLINVSHELRTPLTLIYAPLKRLLESHKLDSEVNKVLNSVLTQSKNMIWLVNMTLDVRVMEEGYKTLHITSSPLNEWIQEVVNDFQLEYSNKQITLLCECDERIENLHFDRIKCQIALSNLLMNAYKYSPSHTTVVVKSELKEGKVRVSVIDQGIGLKGVDIKQLFERFVVAQNRSNSWGIGLSYTKSLIELHPNGQIGAYANAEKGSTFYFELPLNLNLTSQSGVSKQIMSKSFFDSDYSLHAAPTDIEVETSQMSILVAEDEPEMSAFIQDMLTPYFRTVYTANNGLEAYDIIKKEPIDFVLSDVLMPYMNGFELCSQIKNDIKRSHIPVMLLTTQADAQSRLLGYKSGADLYLPKPFDAQSLIAMISSVLNNREKVRRSYSSTPNDPAVKDLTFSSPDEEFMTKLNDYITQHISDVDLSADMIISHLCMSRATFYKKLKAIANIGIMEYITKRRLLLAATRLEESSAPVATIALSVGYSDAQRFSRAFRQHFGYSPSQYRKSHGERQGQMQNFV